jgi:hypothetical protein
MRAACEHFPTHVVVLRILVGALQMLTAGCILCHSGCAAMYIRAQRARHIICDLLNIWVKLALVGSAYVAAGGAA